MKELIFEHEEINLYYIRVANAFQLALPSGQFLAIPAENIEDLQTVMTAAKNFRDSGVADAK